MYRTLLVLAPDEQQRVAVVRVLRDDFGHVDQAASVEQAGQSQPDLVLVDAGGDQAGSTCASVRAVDRLGQVPQVVLVDNEATAQAAEAAGAEEVLAKPYAPGQLRARVRTLLLRTRLPDPRRLAAVRATGLLDAPVLPVLQDLTAAAAKSLGVPTALVSLVEVDRQYFASHVGLRPNLAAQRQTHISYSFCQHVAATDAPFVVEDARTRSYTTTRLSLSWTWLPMRVCR